ncbi:MAG: DinB family protein [Frankiales bacterium]|nr:DinB family protein [Frankiales bacterium]
MTITPDDKDWTWVLQQPCEECGFDTRAMDSHRVGDMLRANAADWTYLLRTEDEPALRTRPTPTRWSPIEYGCHVRDVFRVFAERLHLMLTEDDPGFANWDQDTTALERDYAGEDSAVLAREIDEAAARAAAAFDAVPTDAWDRTGRRSDGARFTVDSLARYFAHDPIHHLHDVTGRTYAEQSQA